MINKSKLINKLLCFMWKCVTKTYVSRDDCEYIFIDKCKHCGVRK